MSKILTILALRPATLANIEARLRDGGGEERQPAPRKFVFADRRGASQLPPETSQTLAVWTGQEPGERIANTILLCAIRDRAHQVTLEPGAKGVKVRFEIESGAREQKLPAFALEPIVRHFKTLASDDTDRVAKGGTDNSTAGNSQESSVGDLELFGQVAIAVDQQLFQISFSPLPTAWGAGVKVQFSARDSF